ncbi:MAG: FapA family protein, partial [Desulfonatronovibrio sp.]
MFFNQVNLELYVTEDRLKVKVKSYTPSSGRSSSLTAKQVLSQLKKTGIRIDVDHDLINEVVTRAATGHDIAGMTVLKGIPPRKKGEKRLKLKGNPDFPVFKGMPLGTLEILDKDIPGRDVFNQAILPSSTHKSQDFKVGKGCVFDKDTGNILARGYAQVLLSFNEIKLKPLFRISPDKIKITSVIFHSDFSGRSITPAMIQDSLTEMKIDENAVNHQAIESALIKAGKTKTPQITVVAGGKPPVNGRDGYFEPSEALNPPSVDEKDLSAKIDFREQSIFRTVKKGTFLGKIYPPKPGQDGYDVFGLVISANHGKNAEIYAGENVEISSPDNAEEGKYTKSDSENNAEAPITGELIALEEGMVVLEKNRISIRDFMRINGDIDYSTGNIRLETGSVEITGTV